MIDLTQSISWIHLTPEETQYAIDNKNETLKQKYLSDALFIATNYDTQKWPELEEAILNRKISAGIFNSLDSIIKYSVKNNWHPEELLNKLISDVPEHTIYWACVVLKRRWPECENRALATLNNYSSNFKWLYPYIQHFPNKRWFELEQLATPWDFIRSCNTVLSNSEYKTLEERENVADLRNFVSQFPCSYNASKELLTLYRYYNNIHALYNADIILNTHDKIWGLK